MGGTPSAWLVSEDTYVKTTTCWPATAHERHYWRDHNIRTRRENTSSSFFVSLTGLFEETCILVGIQFSFIIMASTSKAFNKCVDPCPRYLRWHTQSLRLLFGQGARTRCPWGENLCATSSTFAGRRHMIGKVVTGCVAILPYHTATQDRGSECRDFRFHIAYRYTPTWVWRILGKDPCFNVQLDHGRCFDMVTSWKMLHQIILMWNYRGLILYKICPNTYLPNKTEMCLWS